MLPLRLLLTPYDALSLPERARALVLAREAGTFYARLLGVGADRASGVQVWQRLIVEEALLRGVIDMEPAFALMQQARAQDAAEPRVEAFVSAWMGYADPAGRRAALHASPRRAAPPQRQEIAAAGSQQSA